MLVEDSALAEAEHPAAIKRPAHKSVPGNEWAGELSKLVAEEPDTRGSKIEFRKLDLMCNKEANSGGGGDINFISRLSSTRSRGCKYICCCA